MLTSYVNQNTFFSMPYFYSQSKKSKRYKHIIRRYFKFIWKPSSQLTKTTAIHSQRSLGGALTTHARLPTLLQCRRKIFSPPSPCVLCWADAHTGMGKAIVSNCNAQDFDYTLALKAQHCKRTIAQRAPSSRRCNFSPFLMREHIKR